MLLHHTNNTSTNRRRLLQVHDVLLSLLLLLLSFWTVENEHVALVAAFAFSSSSSSSHHHNIFITSSLHSSQQRRLPVISRQHNDDDGALFQPFIRITSSRHRRHLQRRRNLLCWATTTSIVDCSPENDDDESRNMDDDDVKAPLLSATSNTINATESELAVTETDNKKKKIDYQWTKQTFAIALPALIGMMADPLLSLMDTGYVGRLGKTPLAALGPCTSIFHLAFNAFRATTAATTSLVASSLGEGGDSQTPNEQTRQVTAISLQLGLTIGISVLVTLLATGRLALQAMGVSVDGNNSNLYPYACDYLFTRLWAAPAVLWIGVAEGAFRGYGNTMTPLKASLTASFINLVLDPLFIFKNKRGAGGFAGFGWGVRGAAAATALSQLGAALYYTHQLVKRRMLPQRNSKRDDESSITQEEEVETATTAINSSSNTTTDATITLMESVSNSNISSATESMDVNNATITTSNVIGDDNKKDFSSSTTPDNNKKSSSSSSRRGNVIASILSANVAMWTKQGSLLLGWAYASARATRLGEAHVAAHQVALSVWLVFALILDGSAIASQVLMGRTYSQGDCKAVTSLIKYMLKFALLQGLASMILVDGLDWIVPRVFTTDAVVRQHLHTLMAPLALQQVLVSLTLMTESLAIGATQFSTLAVGTAIATMASMWQLSRQTTVEGIWNVGIVTLFAGRLVTAVIAVVRAQLKLRRQTQQQQQQEEEELQQAASVAI